MRSSIYRTLNRLLRSLIGSPTLTSNPPFACVAAAMIDRIVHHAEVLTLKGSRLPTQDIGIEATPARRIRAVGFR
jgi:hypothetical protein